MIDVTHGIEPQAVLQGALVLASTLPYVPEGVHLAVVDPGVGSDRRAVAIRDREGRVFVGPDNGLLVPAAERGGIEGAWALENAAYRLERVSRTFHGRDVFAPAAAYIATGVMPEELGPALEPASLVRLELPAAEIREGEIRTIVLLVDRFGNAQLNVVAADSSGPASRRERRSSSADAFRDRRSHVRGCSGRGLAPLRGRLRAHGARDRRRECRGDALDPRRRRADNHPQVAGSSLRGPLDVTVGRSTLSHKRTFVARYHRPGRPFFGRSARLSRPRRGSSVGRAHG